MKKFFYKLSNISFRKLEKADILEIGHGAPEKLIKFLKNYKFETFNPYKELNVYQIVSNFIKFKFDFDSYIRKIISDINPKIIITFNDNNISYYKLKKSFPKIIFISLQNGYRTKHRDFFDKLKKHSLENKLSCDYYCTFNQKISDELSKYIKFNRYVIGSVKNNYVKKANFIKKKKDLLFISQFRKEINLNNTIIKANKSFKNFWIEIKFLRIVNNYCLKKKINFVILGSSINQHEIEKLFYKRILGTNIKIIKRYTNYQGSYQEIDKYENILSVDSTLAYEAASRNKKILIFNSRESKKDGINYKDYFGFPMIMPKNCNFIVNNLNKKIIEEKIKYLLDIDLNKWKKNNNYLLKDLMVYDYNNKKLQKLIKKNL